MYSHAFTCTYVYFDLIFKNKGMQIKEVQIKEVLGKQINEVYHHSRPLSIILVYLFLPHS